MVVLTSCPAAAAVLAGPSGGRARRPVVAPEANLVFTHGRAHKWEVKMWKATIFSFIAPHFYVRAWFKELHDWTCFQNNYLDKETTSNNSWRWRKSCVKQDLILADSFIRSHGDCIFKELLQMAFSILFLSNQHLAWTTVGFTQLLWNFSLMMNPMRHLLG